jgi:GH15 family glucan-1,4-alpha-glucosidase
MTDLATSSIDLILENQAPSGAYIASPNFSNYTYCWFRDGAYIAYCMDLVGEHSSAGRFHQWAAKVITSREKIIHQAIDHAQRNGKPSRKHYLHARYQLNGEDDHGDWPNYQLDGFGTWLWSLAEHARVSGESISPSIRESIQLVCNYLIALWKYPCSDCWEEFPEKIHTYTLGSIYAGIKAVSPLIGEETTEILDQLRKLVNEDCVQGGHFTKYLGTNQVDANLIGLAVPYHLVELDHPLMTATVERIEKDLLKNGGLHRYLGDSYYGGGEWILLTAWLGWYWADRREKARARELLSWIESQADERGYLPEQIPQNLNQPEYFQIWRKRWGKIANPLLWSHAKYLILHNALKLLE